jgi:CBS domain-containing protein
MTAEPITIAPAAPGEAAVTLMTEHGIHHLPVMEAERLAGVVGLRQAALAAQPGAAIGLGIS